MAEEEDIYYGLGTSEQLRHHELDSFVESYLDEREPADWPHALEVVKWERQKIGDADLPPPEDLYTMLDEEYGDPEGEPTVPSDNVRALWKQYAAAVKDEYYVWACEPTDEVTKVDIEEWVRLKRPDWFFSTEVVKRFEKVTL